jgi:hypothetical protein
MWPALLRRCGLVRFPAQFSEPLRDVHSALIFVRLTMFKESAVVIMIAGCDRRDAWVGPSSRPEMITSEPVLGMAVLQRERNGALFGVQGAVRSKSV